MRILLLASAVISALLISCQSSKNKETPATELVSSMTELKTTLTELLPIVADQKAYNDPKNKNLIEDKVQKLVQVSKKVNHSPTVAHSDPTMRFVSSAFNEDLQRIEESLRLGKRDYARYSLMNVTNYCIECHTRTSAGPSFSSPELEKVLPQLSSLERAEFLIAARNFDPALKDLKKFIAKKLSDKKDTLELEKAVRYALAITVKYQRDSKKSMQVVQLIEKGKNTPYFLKQNAKGWKKAIQEWQKEKKPGNQTSQTMIAKAKELIQKAQANEDQSADRSEDIYYLRALSLLHLALAGQLPADQQGQALLLTGEAYEAVKEMTLWSLHENYFESCVRTLPHTEWSKKCFQKYEASIRFGYTGSSGISIPADVKEKLIELEKLAL